MPVKIQFPKGVEVDPGFVSWAEQALSAAGISQAQADVIVAQYQSYSTERIRVDTLAGQAAADREVERLKNIGGKDWDANIAAGKKAVKALGLSTADLDAIERSSGLSATMNLLAKLGRNISSDDGAQDKISIPSADQAARSIDELKADEGFQKSLRDRRDPKHDENLRVWEAAHAARYPAQETAPAVPTSTPSSTPAKPAGGTSHRSVAALRADQAFQSVMRNPADPGRAGAVAEWQAAHEAEAPKT